MVVPAVDLRGGRCVQLVGGRYDAERVSLADPVSVARRWSAAGFPKLHLVDLDRATGRGTNQPLVHRILADRAAPVRVGGGLREEADLEAMISRGAASVVVGTRAVSDLDWLGAVAARWPGRIVVAADVRGSQVLTRGWEETTTLRLPALLEAIDPLQLGGVLVTAVEVEGRLAGPDLDVTRLAVRTSRHPVVASGGIATVDDLRALADVGAAEAVVGMALYLGRIDPITVTQEFAG